MLELVVIILGIIVAGGFLLYFIGDLLMGMANKGKKDENLISKKQMEETKKLEERINALENAEELKKNPAIATILYNGGMIEDYNPEEEEAQNEEEVQEVSDQTQEAEEEIPAEEITEAPAEENVEENAEEAEEDETETEDIDEAEDDISSYIARRRQELMEKLARIKEESENEEDEDSLNLDETEEQEEETEETQEESVEETTEEVASEETVEEVEEAETTEEQEDAQETPASIAEEEEEEAPVETVVVKTLLGDLSELEEKLASAQERLKANEKELRRCKKEYIPLRKVKKTLEKDENKLRRKEALVAKQKVMLYGVNNYADIDEEKAKKLAEDLDLLDGLKLSVQHCHEVMDNNKERYPLLEQIYTLLVNKNNDLKGEIKSLQEAIAKIKEEQE